LPVASFLDHDVSAYEYGVVPNANADFSQPHKVERDVQQACDLHAQCLGYVKATSGDYYLLLPGPYPYRSGDGWMELVKTKHTASKADEQNGNNLDNSQIPDEVRLTIGDYAKVVRLPGKNMAAYARYVGAVGKIVADGQDEQPYQVEGMAMDNGDLIWFYPGDLIGEEVYVDELVTNGATNSQRHEGERDVQRACSLDRWCLGYVQASMGGYYAITPGQFSYRTGDGWMVLVKKKIAESEGGLLQPERHEYGDKRESNESATTNVTETKVIGHTIGWTQELETYCLNWSKHMNQSLHSGAM